MNILLVQLKRIGDLIVTTPAIAAVRAKFPEAKITLVVSSASRELLPAIRGVDKTLVARGRIADALAWFTVARKRYDYCFDFTRTDRSAFVTLLSGARKRVTADHRRFRTQLRSRSYNELVDVPINQMHTVDYHLALLEPLGIRNGSPAIQLSIPAGAGEVANRILANAGLTAGEFLIIHPGSARPEKFWQVDRWARIIEVAAEHHLKCVITGAGSPIEQAHIADIRAHSGDRVVDLSGQVDLLTLAALIKRAKLLITVDSAPMHLAAATHTPQVVLFGPTNPLHWAPRFTPAVILQAGQAEPVREFNPKQKPVPMNLLSTELVIDGMEALLAATKPAPSVCPD
ncbi:MAG: putative lipopolysaccharide heptosyltransferase III [Chthoniobacterales bacterium]|nr:putative lipopolysaccharide heptosyltransferase III [Chthoniobacterales bacterium]